MSETVQNKRVFNVELDGQNKEFAVLKPNYKVIQQGNLIYNRAFREAVAPSDGKKGALVRQKIEDVLREQQLWDDEKQAEYEKLIKSILDGEKTLKSGGINLSKAKNIALKMSEERRMLRALLAERNSLDLMTAESQAEQARFSYFVSSCTVYGDTGKQYFKDEEDYLSRENDPVVPLAQSHMSKMMYGLEDDYEKKLPENKFLLKYKFVDDNLRLIDKSGNFVDSKGRRVDADGRLINDKGDFVDSEGNLLTKDGEYKVEFQEFIDDVYEEEKEESSTSEKDKE